MPSSHIYKELKDKYSLTSYSKFLNILPAETTIKFNFAVLKYITIYPNFRYAMIPSNTKKYIVIVGKKDINLDNLRDSFVTVYSNQIELYPEELLDIEFADLDKIFKKLKITLDSNLNDLEEDDDLTFTSLHGNFEPTLVLEVNDNLNFTSDIFHQSLIAILLENKKHIILDFSESVLKLIKLLNENNVQEFHYKFLYKAIISSTWEEMFLQLYRMIERVFPIFHYFDIYSRYEIKEGTEPVDIMAFSQHIESFFGKRPDEQTVVKQVIKSYANSKDHLFFNLLCKSENSTESSINPEDISSAGTYFYAIRNALIHAREVFTNPSEQRYIHAKSLIDDEEAFKILIEYTLKLVNHTYKEIVGYLDRQK